MKYNKAIVIGGTSGIGHAISKNLKKICVKVVSCSRKDIDTSHIESVKNFIKKNKTADILVLNTGGPPPLSFKEISEDDWQKYFNQLFLSFFLLVQKINIKKNGFIFHISSAIIKEPSPGLIISSSLRTGFCSALKCIAKDYQKKNVTTLNIAPGPFKTRRVQELVDDIKTYEKKLPLKYLGDPDHIGKFIKFIVEHKIKYLTGSTIYFDGDTLNSFM